MKRDVLQLRADSLTRAFFGEMKKLSFEKNRGGSTGETVGPKLQHFLHVNHHRLSEKLAALGISSESVLAFTLTPVVATAWADGDLDEKEKKILIQCAQMEGITDPNVALDILGAWLTMQPDPGLMNNWKMYAEGLRQVLPPEDFSAFKAKIIKRIDRIAQASGKFWDFGKNLSAEENLLIEEARQVLH